MYGYRGGDSAIIVSKVRHGIADDVSDTFNDSLCRDMAASELSSSFVRLAYLMTVMTPTLIFILSFSFL
jgi:hypothetical protein